MSDFFDFFANLVNSGATGTADPAAAGLAPPASPGMRPPGLQFLDWRNQRLADVAGAKAGERMEVAPGQWGDAEPPPPPIPGPPQAAPSNFVSQLPGLQYPPQLSRGGGAQSRVLAQLANAQPIQAPDGQPLSNYIQPAGPWGPGRNALTDGSLGLNMSGGAGPAAQPPGPAPENLARFAQQAGSRPSPLNGAQQQPGGPAAAAPMTMGRVAQMEASPHFGFPAPPSMKPDMWDNLLRFGLAAMASGGKPGATTLGALGEAGVSTVDSSQKAKQHDFENSITSRKLYFTGQDIINKRLEHAEALQQRADAIKENNETKMLLGQQAAEARRDAMDLRDTIASGNQALAQQKIQEMQRENQQRDTARTDATADRATRTAETAEKNAADFYGRRRTAMEKAAPLGTLSEEQEAQLQSQTAQAHPNSNFVREWSVTKQGYLDTVRRGLEANPGNAGMRKQAMDKLRSLGINPREL